MSVTLADFPPFVIRDGEIRSGNGEVLLFGATIIFDVPDGEIPDMVSLKTWADLLGYTLVRNCTFTGNGKRNEAEAV